MPYTITTTAEQRLVEVYPPIAHRAVATPEEAQQWLDNFGTIANVAMPELPEEGGTIRPLPGGGTIKVEAVEWNLLAAYIGHAHESSTNPFSETAKQAIVAAYNTLEGVG